MDGGMADLPAERDWMTLARMTNMLISSPILF
jgi:hypothetical protein